MLLMLFSTLALANPPNTRIVEWHTGGWFSYMMRDHDIGAAFIIDRGLTLHHPWLDCEVNLGVGPIITSAQRWDRVRHQWSPLVEADVTAWIAQGPFGVGGQLLLADWAWSSDWELLPVVDLGIRFPGTWLQLHVVGGRLDDVETAYYGIQFGGQFDDETR